VTAVRASEAARRFTDAAKLPPVVLVFGPDRGLVTEVTARIAALFPEEDPFAVVRLDAATVAQDPARLSDEAYTVSLFGGRRLVVVRDGASRNLAPAVEPLLDSPPRDSVVVVEAGDLRRGTGLRKRVEDHREAAAVSCPADGERDLEALIDEEAQRLGLVVEADARAALVARIGGDRAASRAEVEKACLHADKVLTVADVDAVVGDVAVSEAGEAVAAAFLGDRAGLDRLAARVLRDNAAAVSLLMAAQAACHFLENGAVAVAAGSSPERAAEQARPFPWGFPRQAAPRVLDRWTPRELRAASELVAAALFRTRLMPQLAAAVARDALLRIAARGAMRR
jgi:DNA polymerase-3 subunit delta